MTCVAIIPARGGSKSVPRKNVLPLAGKPLIAHTIDAARNAKGVDRVIVSTDDAEIKAVALRYGADVIDRPVELASDTASSESALLHAVAALEKKEGVKPDLLVFLQCTSPFTRSADIEALLAKMHAEDADSAFSAVPFQGFVWIEREGDMVGVNHDKRERLRRQDRHPEFLENGAVYAMKVPGFIESGHRFFGKTVAVEMDADRGLEIDEPADVALAKAQIASRGPARARLPHPVAAVVFDFDGVFTDDGVLVTQQGDEAVMCSRRDGMGIELLRKSGILMCVISKEQVPIVMHRCEKLQLEAMHGINDKLSLLRKWLDRRGADSRNTVYVGNDVNDIECMDFVGCSVAPNDAHPAALERADIVLSAGGGKGAVRELADLICDNSPDRQKP